MAERRYPTVLLFGAPGVGKGTQGAILGRIPGFFHLSCGEVFRSLNIQSPEGREIYEYSSKGQLVPDDLTIRIWNKALRGHIELSHYKPPYEFLILDGIPRNPHQAELISESIDVLKVVHLVCANEQAMVDRIKRRAIRENRSDDANEGVIKTRFEVYRKESEPVIDCYPSDTIAEVEANLSPMEVLQQILGILIPVHKKWQSELGGR